MNGARPRTRIQKKNTAAILKAALRVFSAQGFAGATLDEIAREAGLSKPNLLYYFGGKEQIYLALLSGLLETWLDPLRALDESGDPVEEIVQYALRKLEMSRRYPLESRLFAGEIVGGAPRLLPSIQGPLKALVDEKAALIARWQREGRLAPLDPHHLIFSIWATTQHYADFEVQVQALLPGPGRARYDGAAGFLSSLYRSALAPGSHGQAPLPEPR